MLNVNDGSLSDVVSCNQTTREWSSGDIDPSATSIISAIDNEDGTVDVTLRRNDEIKLWGWWNKIKISHKTKLKVNNQCLVTYW